MASSDNYFEKEGKKKTASKQSAQQSNGSVKVEHVQSDGPIVRPKTLLLRSYSQLNDGQAGCEDQCSVVTPLTASSRLCKTLQEVLHDRDALPYFVQFMESRDAEPLVRFWLDAESFQASAVTRVRSHSHLSLGQVTVTSSHPSSSSQHNSDIGHKAKHKQCEESGVEECLTQSPSKTSQGASVNAGHGDSSDVGNTSSGVNSDVGSMSSQGDSGVQGPANSIRIQSAAAASDSFAHGGSSGPVLSQTPPGSSPCDASSSSFTGQRRSQVKGHTVVSHSDQTLASQVNSAIFSESNTSGESSNSGNTCSAETQKHSGDGAPLHISSAAISQQSGHAHSVINSSSPSSDDHSGAVSQTEGKLSATNESGAKQSLQDRLLQNIAEDAVRIFSKYIAKDATHPIGVTDELRQNAIRRICREDGLVDPHSFVPCQEFAVERMQLEYHRDFMQSEFHCKHQIDLLTSAKVYLSDILYNDTAMSYLMEFMEQESAMPLLQCWLDLENFQQFLMSRSPDTDWLEAQNDAMVLYDKYFSLQATQPLGFEDKIRYEVECNICREGGPLPDCFAKPKNIVTKVLNTGYFPQFIQSEIYFKYLSDLINTVQLSQDVPNLGTRKRKGSGSGSEHSAGSTQSEISSKNTLLAGGRKVGAASVGKAISRLGPDMQIDTALFNPDSLWQRNQTGGLTLAKIDEMGRFVSEFETQPDNDKNAFAEFGFFKKHKEKEKAQQDMALQIANMIISDITNTTQEAQNAMSSFTSEPLPK